jgi:N utilization substance protein B
MSGSRRVAREYVLRGLYSWQLSRQDRIDIAAALREDPQFKKADDSYFGQLFQGVLESIDDLNAAIAPHLDRAMDELSPIEKGILLIGAYELANCPDVPYRVAINEAVELAKQYGGTDGHKYVNGVLDKLAKILRPDEISLSTAARKS